MDSGIGQMAYSQQEMDGLRQRESARRVGRTFIRVLYRGNIIPRVDSDGTVCNIRIHAIEDIDIFPIPDYEHPGREKMEQRIITTMVRLKQDPATGDIYSDVLDTINNRHFLASNKEMFEPIDAKIAGEIEALVGRPFKQEPEEEELLKRQIGEMERRLETLRSDKFKTKKKKKNLELEDKLNAELEQAGTAEDEKVPEEVIETEG